ncbi:MAG: sugar O-acetyltransferase, partial [Paramuribaculum sp.]|nr:sugar O-acetyltransferase [Paramuribaculum sp.]
MTEKEKMLAGMLYDANYNSALIAERLECKELCRDYNDIRPKNIEAREALLRKIIGEVKGNILIEQPFYCDYGYNISVGD